MKIKVRCTYTIVVEAPSEHYDARRDIEENLDPATGIVGAAFDKVYLDAERKGTCWACALDGKNEILEVLT